MLCCTRMCAVSSADAAAKRRERAAVVFAIRCPRNNVTVAVGPPPPPSRLLPRCARYGFLSENPDFAQACADAGIVFVGPPARALRQFGSKVHSKQTAIKHGVPVVPATKGVVESLDEARTFCNSIGYPVMVKAECGGGGRGMRVVWNDKDLEDALSRYGRVVLLTRSSHVARTRFLHPSFGTTLAACSVCNDLNPHSPQRVVLLFYVDRVGSNGDQSVVPHVCVHVCPLHRSQSEAKAAFGSGAVFIEKYVQEPRHIEVQILADKYVPNERVDEMGTAAHL